MWYHSQDRARRTAEDPSRSETLPLMSWSPVAAQFPVATLMPGLAQLKGPHTVYSEYNTRTETYPAPMRGGTQAQHMHAHTFVYTVKAHWPAWNFPRGGWCSLTALSKRLISGAIDLAFPGNRLSTFKREEVQDYAVHSGRQSVSGKRAQS